MPQETVRGSDARFIEIERIVVSSAQSGGPLGKLVVVIKHERGAEEKFRALPDGHQTVAECKTYIKLASTASTAEVHRAVDRLHRTGLIAKGPLNITQTRNGKCELTLTGGEHRRLLPALADVNRDADKRLTLTLTVGETLQAFKVAERRRQEAVRALASKAKMMDWLDYIIVRLKLVMELGSAVAELGDVAKAAVAVAEVGFQRLGEIPSAYQRLKMICLECLNDFRIDTEARKAFNTELVWSILDDVMESVISAMEMISRYYSQSALKLIASQVFLSKTEEVKDLIEDLQRKRSTRIPAFLIEIGQKVGQTSVEINVGVEDDKRLRELLLPRRSQFWVKRPCLPGTRESVLRDIYAWAFDDTSKNSRLFWLHGIPGCGKSAVATSTAQSLDTAHRLAGSFFCQRDNEQSRDPFRLIASLAYHLARANRSFGQALLESLEEPELILNKDLQSDFERILKSPLSKTKFEKTISPVVFEVDGLDECDERGMVAKILGQIVKLAPWIKIIVTSRDIPDIRDAFKKSEKWMRERNLFLEDAEDDMTAYLCHEIEEGLLYDIRDDALAHADALVSRAAKLFIVMHTAIEFISVEEEGKLKRMEAVLTSNAVHTGIYAMYATVLEDACGSSDEIRALVKAVIGLVIVTSKTSPLSISGLHAFLPPSMDISLQEFETLIMKLKPVLKLTSASQTGSGEVISSPFPAEVDHVESYTSPLADLLVSAYHASFLDFSSSATFLDANGESHANMFWTNPLLLHQSMATGALEIMIHGTRRESRRLNQSSSGLKFNICALETSHKPNSKIEDLDYRIARFIPSDLRYSTAYWLEHLQHCDVDSTLNSGPSYYSDAQKMRSMLHDLLRTCRSLYWLEVMSLTGRLGAARDILVKLSFEIHLAILEGFRPIVSELRLFVDQFLSAISYSTPHLYLALTWIPQNSELWGIRENSFPKSQVLTAPISSRSKLLLQIPCARMVDTFAVSPDGMHLASGSRDGFVRVHHLVTKDLMASRQVCAPQMQSQQRSGFKLFRRTKLSSDVDPIDAIAFVPDGRRLICLSGSFIYELHTDSLLAATDYKHLPVHNIRCLSLSPEGKYIVVGCEEGTIAIMDSNTYTVLREIRAHRNAVNTVIFSPDGSRLASASDDETVCLWDVLSGERIGNPFKVGWPVSAVVFSLDGRSIASGSWAGEVKSWDVESGEAIGEPWDVKYPVLFSSFTPDRTRFIAAVSGEEVWLYFKPGEAVNLPSLSEARCHSTGVTPDGSQIYLQTKETSVQVWDADVLIHRQMSTAGHTDCVRSVAFTLDGQRIISGSDDGSIRAWDAQTGEPLVLTEMRHPCPIWFVTFSPDGKHIASGGRDNAIRIWDAQTGYPVKALEGHTDAVLCGAYSSDGTRIVTGSLDSTLCLWDASSGFPIGAPMTAHDGWVWSVAFSPNDSLIASTSEDSTIRLWDGWTGKALGGPLIGHQGVVKCVAFYSSGTRMVSGGSDEVIRLWDVQKRCSIGMLEGHTSTIWSVAFSPDDAFLYSSSADKTIRCWDMSSGEALGHPLIGHKSDGNSLAVSKDGRRIATGSQDKSVRVWDTRAFKWGTDQLLASCGLRGPNKIPAFIPADGWIRTSEGGLLLWVPDEYRNAVCDMSLSCISRDDGDKSIRILWNKLCCGENWPSIRQV